MDIENVSLSNIYVVKQQAISEKTKQKTNKQTKKKKKKKKKTVLFIVTFHEKWADRSGIIIYLYTYLFCNGNVHFGWHYASPGHWESWTYCLCELIILEPLMSDHRISFVCLYVCVCVCVCILWKTWKKFSEGVKRGSGYSYSWFHSTIQMECLCHINFLHKSDEPEITCHAAFPVKCGQLVFITMLNLYKK